MMMANSRKLKARMKIIVESTTCVVVVGMSFLLGYRFSTST